MKKHNAVIIIVLCLLVFPVPLFAQERVHHSFLLKDSASSTPDVVYWYDHTEQRVRKTSGTGATTTHTKYYELSASGSTIKSIFTPDGELVDTLSVQVYYASTASSTTAVEYIHPDHLGSMVVGLALRALEH